MAPMQQWPALLCALVALLIFSAVPAAARRPVAPVTLHAPFTAFHSDGSVNTDVVPALAAQAAKMGVNVIWVCGSMAQFDGMSTAERKQLAEAWVREATKHNMYTIVHVGSTVQSMAIELAEHAKSIGADAIASVPPYYNKPRSIDDLLDFFTPVSKASGDLPFFYYHIPGMTNYNVKIADLFAAAASKMPSLAGVKFVADDNLDWFQITQTYNTTHTLLFAPEPKMQSFALGLGAGAVLAEDFYAPTYLRMRQHYTRSEFLAAQNEQAWKYKVMDVFGKYGGGVAERAAYKRMCGVDMGKPRAPEEPFDESNYDAMVKELDALGFFNQTAPTW